MHVSIILIYTHFTYPIKPNMYVSVALACTFQLFFKYGAKLHGASVVQCTNSILKGVYNAHIVTYPRYFIT